MTPWQNRVTDLTRRMADDMKVRNYSQRTIDCYTYHVGEIRGVPWSFAAGSNRPKTYDRFNCT